MAHLVFLSMALLSTRSQSAAINPRGAPWDQIRLGHCSKADSHVAGYNEWPPFGLIPPDDITARADPSADWDKVWHKIDNRITGKGATVSYDIPAFKKGNFQQYVGNATYNGVGFNCLEDDGHAVWEDSEWGQCYTDVFCTHQEGVLFTVQASEDVVTFSHTEEKKPPAQKWQYSAKDVLSKLDQKRGKTMCDQGSVDLEDGCSISFVCHSADQTGKMLETLGKVLVDTLAEESSLVKWETKTHIVARGIVMEDFALTMPQFWGVQASNIPPPESTNNPSPQAWIDATITCKRTSLMESLCTALGMFADAGGLIDEAAKIAGIAGLAVEGGCTKFT